MANVLSYALLTKKYRVVSDLKYNSPIFMHTEGKGWYKFEKLDYGLYVFDTNKPLLTIKSDFINYNFLQTVSEKSSKYIKSQVDKATKIR